MKNKNLLPIKILEAKEAYEVLSGSLSRLSMIYSIAGFAVAFIIENKETMLLFLVSLVFGILQYTSQVSYWYFLYNKATDTRKEMLSLMNDPGRICFYYERINVIAMILFYLKVSLCLAGMFVLMFAIIDL